MKAIKGFKLHRIILLLREKANYYILNKVQENPYSYFINFFNNPRLKLSKEEEALVDEIMILMAN